MLASRWLPLRSRCAGSAASFSASMRSARVLPRSFVEAPSQVSGAAAKSGVSASAKYARIVYGNRHLANRLKIRSRAKFVPNAHRLTQDTALLEMQVSRREKAIARSRKRICEYQQLVPDRELFFSSYNLPRSVFSYTKLIKVMHAHQMSPSHVLDTFSQMKANGLVPNHYTYAAVLNALVSNRDHRSLRAVKLSDEVFEAALSIFNEYTKYVERPRSTVLSAMLKVCASAAQYELAQKIVGMIDPLSFDNDSIVLERAMRACCRAGRYDQAWDCFRNNRHLVGIPDASLLTRAIQVCGKLKHFDDAINLFDDFLRSGNKPSTIHFNVMMNASLWEHVPSLYKRMIDLECEPDVFTFNIATIACAKSGNVEFALQLLQDIDKSEAVLLEVTFQRLLGALSRSQIYPIYTFEDKVTQLTTLDRVHLAEEIVEAMQNRNELDISLKTLNHLLHVYTHAGLIDGAVRVVESFAQFGHSPDLETYKAFLSMFVKAINPADPVIISRIQGAEWFDPSEEEKTELMQWALAVSRRERSGPVFIRQLLAPQIPPANNVSL